VLCAIARQLLPHSPVDFTAFESHKKIREAIAATVPGMEQLADIDVAKQEFHIRNRIMHTPVFKTPSGKGRFCVHSLPSQNADAAQYPFTLASIRSEGQFNSIIYEEKDSYRGTEHRQTILMNRDDLKKLGLRDGDKTTLRSPWGEMPGVTVKPYDLPPGNILAYYPEANVLIGTERDPRSQTPAFKSVAVAVVQD